MNNVMKAFRILSLGLGFGLAAVMPATAQQSGGLGEYDQIIIKRKGDKGEKGEKSEKQGKGSKEVKLTVVIKDDKIEINGKPIEEFDHEAVDVLKRDIVIRDGNTIRLTVPRAPRSPFHDGGVQIFPDGGSWGFSTSPKAFLGVTTTKVEKGAKITNVSEGTAAEKAGLKKGDIITQIDDVKIESPEDLTRVIGQYKPDEKIRVTYIRDGKTNHVSANLGKRNSGSAFNLEGLEPLLAPFGEQEFRFENHGQGGATVWSTGQPKLGIKAQDTEDGKGVKVIGVDKESAAEKAGLREGDIIVSFDGKAVNKVEDLVKGNRIARETQKSSLPVEYLRDGKSGKVELKIPRKLRTAVL
jgi:serine protease Do